MVRAQASPEGVEPALQHSLHLPLLPLTSLQSAMTERTVPSEHEQLDYRQDAGATMPIQHDESTRDVYTQDSSRSHLSLLELWQEGIGLSVYSIPQLEPSKVLIPLSKRHS
jgi:hypothetical protein